MSVGPEGQRSGLVDGEQVRAAVAVEIGQCHIAAGQGDEGGQHGQPVGAFERPVAVVVPAPCNPVGELEHIRQSVAVEIDELGARVADRRRRQ